MKEFKARVAHSILMIDFITKECNCVEVAIAVDNLKYHYCHDGSFLSYFDYIDALGNALTNNNHLFDYKQRHELSVYIGNMRNKVDYS